MHSDSNVIIGVVDTGVDYTHPDLKESIWVNDLEIGGDGIDNDGNGYIDDVMGYDFDTHTPDPRPSGDPHGTHVAGQIKIDYTSTKNDSERFRVLRLGLGLDLGGEREREKIGMYLC